MHLVIGAGEFLAGHVSKALAADVPVIELNSDADDGTMADAMNGVEVVVNCAREWNPARRLRYRKSPPPVLQRVVTQAQRTGVRRIVHVSTADVYALTGLERMSETSRIGPAHAYERLCLLEERWLAEAAGSIEIVIVRPARVFGVGEDWILPRLMSELAGGRLWLPGGGRAPQTFITGGDVGRACLAAADRGRPGHVYLVGGFDSTWRALVESALRAVEMPGTIVNLPYDLLYLRAMASETFAASGVAVWPGTYGVDVLGRTRLFDDSASRRELTWSPSVGSFEQEIPQMASWLGGLPAVASAAARRAAATSRQGT